MEKKQCAACSSAFETTLRIPDHAMGMIFEKVAEANGLDPEKEHWVCSNCIVDQLSKMGNGDTHVVVPGKETVVPIHKLQAKDYEEICGRKIRSPQGFVNRIQEHIDYGDYNDMFCVMDGLRFALIVGSSMPKDLRLGDLNLMLDRTKNFWVNKLQVRG